MIPHRVIFCGFRPSVRPPLFSEASKQASQTANVAFLTPKKASQTPNWKSQTPNQASQTPNHFSQTPKKAF